MKTLKKRPPGHMKKATGVMAAFLLLFFLLPGIASATTAANAVITNTATVNYDDTGGNPQTAINASVDVTVNLVTAHPTFNPVPADNTTPSGVALAYTYTIISNANGPVAYNLTAADNLPQAGITSQAHSFCDDAVCTNPPIASITLGATSAAATAAIGATSITVPNDGVADASVNGIVVGDVIVIGPDVVTVTAITDTGAGTETITFAGDPLTAAVAVGAQIGEQGTFYSVTTPVATINNSTYVITVTADDGVTAGPAPTDDTTTTVTVISLTVTKFVQNITTPVVCAGGSVNVDTGLGAGAIDYCDSGVTGNPGETLEYVIRVTNGVGAATATDVIISDPVPNFTTLTSNIALDDGIAPAGFDATGTTAEDGDFAEVNAGTIYIYAGDGTVVGEGVDNVGAPGTGGRVAAGATTYGAFRVQITP